MLSLAAPQALAAGLLAGRLVDGVPDRDDPEPSFDLPWGEPSGGTNSSCAW